MADLVRKRKARLYESIVEQIEALIREKTLAPGDQLLPERQLAEQLGVSRAAVREALTALAARGLIEITPGGGAYVREARIESLIDPLATVMLKERDNVFDLLEARRILEVGGGPPGGRASPGERPGPDQSRRLRHAGLHPRAAGGG
ncbi:MAG: GntR family transcriptional regulator [Thermoleophilia bacterium]|nr:GntR family transcriptional regulator [Thermoleophilia bacterium]